MSDSWNLTVAGLQWGDEGKGKIVDYLSGRYGAVARFNGGSNAGHTVVAGDSKYTFHLLPSGAARGKKLLIGAGVAVDPSILREELGIARRHGLKVDLLVDGRCTLVSPLEKDFDSLIEGVRKERPLGTTLRGVGPSYAMRALRLSPRAVDLFGDFDMEATARFYRKLGLEPMKLLPWVREARSVMRGLVGDVASSVEALNSRGESVLFEGSQGALLDILHGTYPYVTSSHTLSSYSAAGSGLPCRRSGRVVGVAKCYTTRVGSGPFPTELGSTLASSIREAGAEYGATTGRPRRIGWLDLVALKYAVSLTGADEIALTKVDVLSSLREFKVCVAYRDGRSETQDFYSALTKLDRVEPVYESPVSLYRCEFGKNPPGEVRKLAEFIEERVKAKVTLVSFGQERSRTYEL